MRALSLALGFAALLASAAVGARAVAQQDAGWTPSLKWGDGKEIRWRAADAPACDGSNVDLQLVNNSRMSGAARMTAITFRCTRGGEFTAPERALGLVGAGASGQAAPISCACAEKGGVAELRHVELDFQLEGPGEDIAANGCSYKGSYAGGMRSGQGAYVCATGYRLEGVFRDGVANGSATETLPNGQVYAGEFVNGVRQGVGRMTYADGAVYNGALKNGLRDGLGTIRYKDGSEYVGDWRADRRQGRGTYVGGGGAWTYDGDWAEDLRNGAGKLSYADGSYAYEGNFRDDLRDGVGAATFADGRVFTGAFMKGDQAGPGSLTFPDGRRIVGEFRDHRPHGKAIDTTADATFDAEWLDGVLQGNATVVSSNGVRFEGLFAGGKRNGIGLKILSDGSKLECRFIEDVAQKPCNRVLTNGRRIEYRN